MVRFADELEALSTGETVQVGCVIFPLDCSNVSSIGYNGMPAGFPHKRPDIELDTEGGSGECHAELNALTKADSRSAPPSILALSRITPCRRCAGQIINAGFIVGVIHVDPYVDEGAGLDMIRDAGILTCHRRELEMRSLTNIGLDPKNRDTMALAAWCEASNRGKKL